MPDTPHRKLIEVSLPLEAINRESAREKSIRHGHPSTLHLWWARRPLAACRAVLFAQLVDDPSAHPERFATEEAQAQERARLHQLIERLVVWENSTDEHLLAEARAEILASTGGNPPPILDPFCGGGSIPLEAQRLGLTAHAADLNPVAVLITKALIEIPPKFAGHPPVFPGATGLHPGAWQAASGLAEDVRRYGQWMRDEAERRIGKHYPDATLPDGTTATVIAWIWARTVTCPNPACGIQMPLARSWWLSKKKGKEAYIVPTVTGGRVHFDIAHDVELGPQEAEDGTVDQHEGARCVGCNSAVSFAHIRAEGQAGRISQQLMAIVAEGNRRRVYLPPSAVHADMADMDPPRDIPQADLPAQALGLRVQGYGMSKWTHLFTNRQLVALTTFSDLVGEARERVYTDALAAGMVPGERLEAGGTGAHAYADAIATYLGLVVSRCADYFSSICSWNSPGEKMRDVFSLPTLSMVWDFAEVNPFSRSSGNYAAHLDWVYKVVKRGLTIQGEVTRASALDYNIPGSVISTDPPYYSSIGYADLSDFFYVWLRRTLRDSFPTLLATMLTPKTAELIANPYRHASVDVAREFFRLGFVRILESARVTASREYPIAIYYALKQSASDASDKTSDGWEAILQSMIDARWSITATWPVRSERTGRARSIGSNALASSIVLVLRPRPVDAPRIDRRGFLNILKAELPLKLRELEQGGIAPVDLPQAAIGPGMAIFTRYAAVLDDDGSPVRVRAALQWINQVLDEVLTDQEGDFDAETRFALAWFRQHGFDAGAFGDADNIARARNTAVEALEHAGILTSRGGKVQLYAPEDLPEHPDPDAGGRISTWEVVAHLTRRLNADGVGAAVELMERVPATVDLSVAKELTFLLFSIAEERGMSKAAVDFNALGTSWNDLALQVRTRAASGITGYYQEQLDVRYELGADTGSETRSPARRRGGRRSAGAGR
ncbi:MAG: DUF1156 domain-containing protein [Micromonosporaceae bacterium]|nr:DUF1156 domain-containing protein [Micromonosporaceae bacterium]